MIGHVPLMFSEVLSKFCSLPQSLRRWKVARKRTNRGTGYDLELAMDFTFYGNDLAIIWAQICLTLIKMDKDSIVKHTMK